MKKIIVLLMISFATTANAFDVFDYGATESEATRKAMKRCIDTSTYRAQHCKVIQVNTGDYGSGLKYQVQVADW